MMKSIHILSAMLLLAAAQTAFADVKYPVEWLQDRPEELTRLIDEALRENEQLKRLGTEVGALGEEVAVAGTLEDPRLSIGVANLPVDTFSTRQEGMTQQQVAVSQVVPWFGKIDLRTQKAVLRQQRLIAELSARRIELARSVSDVYYEMGFVRDALDVNTELVQVVDQMLRVAETAYANGRRPQQDVLQAQVEAGKLLEERAILEKKGKTLNSRINELLNRSLSRPVTVTAALPFPDLRIDVEAIKGTALTQNPLLAARRTGIEMADVDVSLARKEYWPDMEFRLGYGLRDEDAAGARLTDFVSGTVTFKIPVWQNRKQDRALAAANLRRRAAENDLEDLRTSLPHRIEAVFAELDMIAANYHLYHEALLAQADHWSKASLSAYEVGAVDFDTMIGSHMRRLRFGLQAKQYLYSAHQKLAELAALSGFPPSTDETAAGKEGHLGPPRRARIDAVAAEEEESK